MRLPSALLLVLALSACSSAPSLLKSDCHTCTTEDQRWKDFSFAALRGTWKGSVESVENERSSTKKKKDQRPVTFRFISAADFLKTNQASCASVPAEALVLNGLLWQDGLSASKAMREYDAFVPTEDGKVNYGRLSMEQLNGQRMCRFRRMGRVMGKNRMSLPTVSFSEESAYGGRAVASSDETERSVEFLRFAPEAASNLNFLPSARTPSSEKDREMPPLMIRVNRVSSFANHGRGQWKGTEEEIFRLWRVE
jgi:hypothetical protein